MKNSLYNLEKRLNTNQPHLGIMQLTFEENRNLWKFVVGVGFAACGIFLINEIFMTSDNIMNWLRSLYSWNIVASPFTINSTLK